MRRVRRVIVFGAALGLALGINVPLWGQESSTGGGRVSFDASFDVASRYVFRGHEKDGRGVVLQPDAQIGYTLRRSSTGLVRDLTVGAFAWASAHTGHREYSSGLGLYEADLGAAITAGLPGSVTASVIYTGYYAPTGAFSAVHEVALELGWTTGNGPLAVTPTVLVARELSDGGGSEDTYLELGTEVFGPATGVVSWRLPLAVGLSPDGFYTNSVGENEFVGFFGAGIVAGADLADLGLGRVPGSLEAGLTAAFLNPDAGVTQDAGNDVLWTVRVGLSFAFQR